MNKKYMDFVPNKTAKKVEPQSKKVKLELKPKTEVKTVAMPRKMVPKKGTQVGAARKETQSKVANKPKLPVRPAFVNTEKVRKRPLSKNVYPKKPVVPKEEKPTAPVTIIDKPEKDSKVGLIVTIIITIILGAAAGTVAFLLLPK